MKFAEKLYQITKEMERNEHWGINPQTGKMEKFGTQVESVWMNQNTYNRMQKEFFEGEMGVTEDIPREKRSFKEKQYKDRKGKFTDGIKNMDILIAMNAMIRVVDAANLCAPGFCKSNFQCLKDGKYCIHSVGVPIAQARKINATRRVTGAGHK